MTSDPFAVLGVDENAGDEAIKQRYLALVRAHPPDREPDRFQEFRRAYEAIRGERERLEVKLLQTSNAALYPAQAASACARPAQSSTGHRKRR